MYIVQIGSELAPVAKVGGLADVMMGLSRELKWKGNEVAIFLPKYGCLEQKGLTFQKEPIHFQSYFDGMKWDNLAHKAQLGPDLAITFIDPHHPANFFGRDQIYGFSDDAERFLYFSRACLDFLAKSAKKPDIIHIHDWETAPIALLLKEKEFQKIFPHTKCVLTIHNMEYQGHVEPQKLDLIGYKSPKEPLMQGDVANLLKGGITFADAVVTVSPTYAQEVLTEIGSCGLAETLKARNHNFCGILNGLDYTYWNPEIDPLIDCHFSKDSLENKRVNKEAMLSGLGFSKKQDFPFIASISRLVPQKGIELLKYAAQQAKELNFYYVILGTTYDPQTQNEFLELQKEYSAGNNVRIILKSSEPFAHKLYAASDMFLVPSMFEPCGLTQIIALKYGSVPIVRKTGGLADTVFDIEYSGRPFEQTNGFSFDFPDTEGVDFVLKRALSLYNSDKKRWNMLIKQGMAEDHSWNKPADQYLAIYSRIKAG